jgi:Holliday junction resolvasome RuvABC endonuclease subunit
MFSLPDEAARTAHWGVDPGFRRVSIASLVPGRFKVRSATVPDKLPTVETLSELYAVTLELGRELMSYGQPRSIIVEQPSGRFIKPALYYATGVIVLALADFGFVDTLPPTSWKKAAFGNGALKKPELMERAKALGYTGVSQDEADALGIARAGQELTTVRAVEPDTGPQPELPY